MKTYIHYGSGVFDYELLKNGRTRLSMVDLNKPNKGLWGSPVDAEWGWKDWCEGEQFKLDSFKTSFKFTLNSDAKILTITKLSDWTTFLKKHFTNLDPESFDPLYRMACEEDVMEALWDYICSHYDGVEVIMSSDRNNMYMSDWFYSWDCDSIVVWNPDVIKEV